MPDMIKWKKTARVALLAIVAAFLIVAVFSCRTLDTAGGSSGGEAISVSGTVRDTLGNPLVDARISLRRTGLTQSGEDISKTYSDTTGRDGSFLIREVKRGRYLLNAAHPQEPVSRSIPLNLDTVKQSINLESVTLDIDGILSGMVGTDYLPPGSDIILSVRGLDSTFSSTDGRFSAALPPGEYTIDITNHHRIDDVITIHDVIIHPGDTTFFGIPGFDLQKNRDLENVFQFLQNQGLDPQALSSVAIIKNNRVRKLNLSQRNIRVLDESIADLYFVNTLDLSGNDSILLPDTLSSLPHLLHLTLSFNSLETLPSVIGLCTTLVSLDVEGNKMPEIGPEFSGLQALEVFHAASNSFSTFPPVILNWSSLEVLDLGGNQINSIPDQISNLNVLQKLILTKNQLISLPPSLAQCTLLQHLELWSNSITTFPEVITELKHLQYLNLQDNHFGSVSKAISMLKVLEELHLRGNELISLPLSVLSLEKVETITVSDNRICSPEDEVASWLNQHAEASWKTTQRGCE